MSVAQIIEDSLRAKLKIAGDYRDQVPASWDAEYANMWMDLQAALANKTAYRIAYEHAIAALKRAEGPEE